MADNDLFLRHIEVEIRGPGGLVDKKRMAVSSSETKKFVHYKEQQFGIEFEGIHTAGKADISTLKLYNVIDETIKMIIPVKGKSRPYVSIRAGYGDDIGNVFMGEVIKAKMSRTGADTCLTVSVTENYDDFTNIIVETETMQNVKPYDIVKAIAEFLDIPWEVNLTAKNAETIIPQFTFYKSATALLEDLRKDILHIKMDDKISCWTVKFGKLYFQDNESSKKNDTVGIVMDRESGMIGSPEQTAKDDFSSDLFTDETGAKKVPKGMYKIKSLFRYEIRNDVKLRCSFMEGSVYRKEKSMIVTKAVHKGGSYTNEMVTEIEAITY